MAMDTLRSVYHRVASPCVVDLTSCIIKVHAQYLEGGSFGDVYRCQLESGSEVAVKAFRFRFTLEGEGVDKAAKIFRRELHVWKRLNHTNIVPFLGLAHGFGMRNSTSFVSLWMPNGTLESFLSRYDDSLVLTHRLHLLRGIANGLKYLHSFPVVHGDLNPNNVLLDVDYTPRLTDYGCSSSLGATSEGSAYLRRSTMRSESLRWIAPEQVSCNSKERFQKTTKSDIYAFGCIALQVLSGKQPWSEIQEDVSVVLYLAQGQRPARPEKRPMDEPHWEFINMCWSLTQEHRPTAKRVVSAIRAFLDQQPTVQPIRDVIMPLSQQDNPHFPARVSLPDT